MPGKHEPLEEKCNTHTAAGRPETEANRSLNPPTDIGRDADRCVMCGLCLPHCPTYRLYRDEAESPRGRIALMAALAAEELEADAEVVGHLDRCLGCRACERVCPSDVPYGRLYRTARAELFPASPEAAAGVARRLLTGRGGRLLRGAARLYQQSGLQSLLRPRLRGQWGRLERLLPDLPAAPGLPEYQQGTAETSNWVGLFTGCTGALLDTATLEAATRLLNRLGYGVWIPPEQGCCGALDLAAGAVPAARAKAVSNAAAFARKSVTAVVGVASGCTATLSEAGEWAADVAGAPALAARTRDIVAFLDETDWPVGLAPTPLPERVAVHEPCSLRNVLGGEGATARLLRHIPALEPVALPAGCCGAGGTHVLSHPEAADALRAETVEAVARTGATTVVSANIGCALHIGAGLREAGLDCEVVHPVVLLERQLQVPSGK